MTNLIDRTFAAQAVIAVAMSLGTWFVLVEPRSIQAQQLEVEIVAGSQFATSVDQQSIRDLVKQLDEVRSRVRQIDQRGSISRDSSHFYSIIMDLARQHHVAVVSLNPGTSESAPSRRRDVRTPAQNMNLVLQREISVHFAGRYNDVAAFIDAMQSLEGYIEVLYLSIANTSAGDGRVDARMTCRTVRFDLPQNLRVLLGNVQDEDDQQQTPEERDDA